MPLDNDNPRGALIDLSRINAAADSVKALADAARAKLEAFDMETANEAVRSITTIESKLLQILDLVKTPPQRGQ